MSTIQRPALQGLALLLLAQSAGELLLASLAPKYLFDALKLKRPEVRGFALGTSAHSIGAARAWQVHPAAGAFATLGPNLQVLIAALLMPLVLPLLLPRLPS